MTTKLKRGTAVKFRTRHDREQLRGTVVRTHATAKGPYVEIKSTDGAARRVRPANIEAA